VTLSLGEGRIPRGKRGGRGKKKRKRERRSWEVYNNFRVLI